MTRKVSVSGEVRAALVEDDQLQILETCDLGSALSRSMWGKDLLPVAGAVPLSSAKVLVPLAHSCKFFCIGLNYYSHMAEAPPQPEYPIIFTKFPSVLIGPDDEIQLPSTSDMIDWGG